MAKSPNTSSAPRPQPAPPKQTPPPPIVHQGQVSTAQTAVQKGWGGKK